MIPVGGVQVFPHSLALNLEHGINHPGLTGANFRVFQLNPKLLLSFIFRSLR
jgi:hypothetical protein